MQVFKLFFKLLKSYKWIILMYLGIFLGVSLVMSEKMSSDNDVNEAALKETELTIAIIDEDKETLGNALKDYFGKDNELVELEYDKKMILDKLYWRELAYVLVIPDGFEESLLDEKIDNMEFQCMKVPGYFDASFFESELSLYTSKLISLLEIGYSMEEAQQQLLDLQEEETEVSLASFVNASQNDKATIFLNYVPYLFITLGMNGIGLILLRINGTDVKARMECGAATLRERIAGLVGGSLVYGILLMVVVVVVIGILSEGSIYTDVRFPYFLINTIAMLLFGLSMGFFTGSVAKNGDTVNGLVNVVSIGLSFLGGVFVPIEFFSDSIIKVAKFFPTYWYVVTNENIGAMKQMTPELAQDMFWQVALVVGYALVIFAVTIVIIANKRKRVA